MLIQEKLAKELSEKKYLSIEKISKADQTLLLLLFYKTILEGEKYFLGKQKLLAEKLAEHHNSIYQSLDKLREGNYLKKERVKNQLAITMNLDKEEVSSLLLLLSDKLSSKLYQKSRTRFINVNRKSAGDDEQSRHEYLLWEEQAQTVLLQATEVSQYLARLIIDEINEADRNKTMVLTRDDYHVIISLVLLKVQEICPEISQALMHSPDTEQRERLNYKTK